MDTVVFSNGNRFLSDLEAGLEKKENQKFSKGITQKDIIDTLYSDSNYYLIQINDNDYKFSTKTIYGGYENLEQIFLTYSDSILYLAKENYKKRIKLNGKKIVLSGYFGAEIEILKDLEYSLKAGALQIQVDKCKLEMREGIWNFKNNNCLHESFPIKKVIFENNPSTLSVEKDQLDQVFKIVALETNTDKYDFLIGSYVKFDFSFERKHLVPLYYEVQNTSFKYIIEDPDQNNVSPYEGYVLNSSDLKGYKGNDFGEKTFGK